MPIVRRGLRSLRQRHVPLPAHVRLPCRTGRNPTTSSARNGDLTRRGAKMNRMCRMALPLLILLTSCHAARYSPDTPEHAWVQLRVELAWKPCPECPKVTFARGGTAFFVEAPGVSNPLLTVAHVCQPPLPGVVSVVSIAARSPDGRSYSARVVRVDDAADLCLLSANAPWPHKVRLSSRPPRKGESVGYYGAPGGFFRLGLRPEVRGHYNGREGTVGHYTLPVAGGASGSAIVLRDGHLVGVVRSRWTAFPHFSQSPSYHHLKRFLEGK